MPCSKCDHLKSAHAAALAKLRDCLARFEQETSPTWESVDRLENDRQAFDQIRRELEKHLQEHCPKM